MNELEEQLRGALTRSDAPQGFVERVLARAVSDREQRVPFWRWPVLRWAAVAVLVAVTLAGGFEYRVHRQEQERAEAVVAKRQVMVALRITGAKLRIAQEKVKSMESGKETKAEKML